MRNRRMFVLLVLTLWLFTGVVRPASGSSQPPLETVQRRAFAFFWNETNPKTGLTKDRAKNDLRKGADSYTVASIASTGYMLAALPIGVEHKWVTKKQAYSRALRTLRFVRNRLPRVHGFHYHFVDWQTGKRVWKSEISSIDTSLLVLGALTAGEYWPGTTLQRLAQEIAGRMDWQWMQARERTMPPVIAPSMGWSPEKGFIPARWQGYSEAAFLYLLGMGTPAHGLKEAAWDAWTFPKSKMEDVEIFGAPSPIFFAQMTAGYFDLHGLHDRQGRDWWTAWRNAHLADQAYCTRHSENKTYAAGFWGINASDQPNGYGADRPEDGHNAGTVTPTAMLAGMIFTPVRSKKALHDLWKLHDRIWGRYGFSDAFNLEKDWFDPDVIGIDLGMMLLATENAHTGRIWRLMRHSRFGKRGMAAAGFHCFHFQLSRRAVVDPAALDENESVKRCMEMGARAYLLKLFEPEALKTCIRTHLTAVRSEAAVAP